MQEDTIAGIASGMGGGISIIRVSGENALTAVGDIFRTPKYLSDEKKDSDWKSDYFIKKILIPFTMVLLWMMRKIFWMRLSLS